MKSIKQRMYVENGIIIVSIVIILEVIFILVVSDYYLKIAEYKLINKAEVSSGFYNKYLINENIYEKARYILENESKDPIFHMQFFDLDGRMIVDSNGFKSDDVIKEEDFKAAVNGEMGLIKIKDDLNDDSVMAISTPLYHLHKITGVLRYTVSIKQLETSIFKIIITSLFIGTCVIAITFFLSSILADKIVVPIENLTESAETMALGDFSQKCVKMNNDEIGKLADTLNYMAEEIEKSNKVKNEFISSISHELRTPLTAIRGWSEIISSGEVEDEEEMQDGLEIILDETKRLTGLVEELLDFSKLEMGKINLNLEKTDIEKTIAEVHSYFKKRFQQQNIEACLEVEEDNYLANVDENRLKQVFINIIDNAIKFSNENGKIVINMHTSGNNILINIQDNGVGISRGDLNKVKEKFYKGKSKKSGSGIGLSVCNEIVNLHGGKLQIDSIEGEGTRVSIYIPKI